MDYRDTGFQIELSNAGNEYEPRFLAVMQELLIYGNDVLGQAMPVKALDRRVIARMLKRGKSQQGPNDADANHAYR